MDKIYITEAGPAVKIAEDGAVNGIKGTYLPVNWVDVVDTDCTIEYEENGEKISISAKAGQVILVLYTSGEDRVVVLDSPELTNNIMKAKARISGKDEMATAPMSSGV